MSADHAMVAAGEHQDTRRIEIADRGSVRRIVSSEIVSGIGEGRPGRRRPV
jgi:hypothetical protein